MNKILVIGSTNIDYVSYVDAFPKKGETIFSCEHQIVGGGKGANQAIAAQRSSIDSCVSFFSNISLSEAGNEQVKHLKDEGINTSYIQRVDGLPGSAMIVMSKKINDNFIVVNEGVSSYFNKKYIPLLSEAIRKNEWVILQLEVNRNLVENSLFIANKLNRKIIMNASPSSRFKKKWFKYIDWLIVNETELADISDSKYDDYKAVKNVVKA